MPDSRIKNLPASIRQKMLNLAQERNDDFGLVLTKYGLERMLFRLSKSKYRETFILKGALLFELWTKERYRATRDADFLAAGDNRQNDSFASSRKYQPLKSRMMGCASIRKQ